MILMILIFNLTSFRTTTPSIVLGPITITTRFHKLCIYGVNLYQDDAFSAQIRRKMQATTSAKIAQHSKRAGLCLQYDSLAINRSHDIRAAILV